MDNTAPEKVDHDVNQNLALALQKDNIVPRCVGSAHVPSFFQ